jgi:hypothetical protein
MARSERIERGRRLVEDQDRRVLQHRARNRHALLLAARQLQAALADRCLVTLRQTFDEVVNVRGARRRDHFIALSPMGGRSDVVAIESLNSTVSCGTMPIARSESCVTSRISWPSIRIAPPPGRDRRSGTAGGRASICRSRWADHRRRLAGRNREADVVQDRPRRFIRKAHVLEAHLRAAHDSGGASGHIRHFAVR